MKPDNPSEFRVMNRSDAVDLIEARLHEMDALAKSIVWVEAGDRLHEESKHQQMVGLILEGHVDMLKASEEGDQVWVDTLGRGDMVGLLSYFAREVSFTSIVASGPGRILLLDWDMFSRVIQDDADLGRAFGSLMRENLTGRYRRLVNLHLKVAHLNHQLAKERMDLEATIAELERTRNRLINQEKLAMLGQVVAGLAHELNNPVAVIQRNIEYVGAALSGSLLNETTSSLTREFWEAGLMVPPMDSREQRESAEYYRHQYAGLSSPIIRRLSAIPGDLVNRIQPPPSSEREWEGWIRVFESGRFLNTLRSASGRIAGLVRSLKNYARPVSNEIEPIDPVVGIKDTLLVLSDCLKHIEVITDLKNLPKVMANAGELNQVWTNLLINAVEALRGEGIIRILGKQVLDRLIVDIEDNGPGLSESAIGQMFEPHYTTKAKGGQFGLGLGLSISSGIVRKIGGSLIAMNREEGGTRMRVDLPCL